MVGDRSSNSHSTNKAKWAISTDETNWKTHSMVCLSQTVDFFGVLGFPYHAISIRNVHASLSLVKHRTTNCETIIPEKTWKNTGEQSSARYCHCLRARATAPPVGMLHPASDRGQFRRPPCVACAFQRQVVSARWHSPSDFLERTKNRFFHHWVKGKKREEDRVSKKTREFLPIQTTTVAIYMAVLWVIFLLVCTNDYPLVL